MSCGLTRMVGTVWLCIDNEQSAVKRKVKTNRTHKRTRTYGDICVPPQRRSDQRPLRRRSNERENRGLLTETEEVME
jgi:hypothetical protein